VILGLPDFSSRSTSNAEPAWLRAVRYAGFVALAFAAFVALSEWRASAAETEQLQRARADASRAARDAEATRRSIEKNADLLVATSSAESAPEVVWRDLQRTLPAGVAVSSLRIEYSPEGVARVDLGVVARTPDAYDRFLAALGKDEAFADLRPGAETRPGSVRANLSMSHRPKRTGDR
jgi:hypothetical protein